jgi:hypothetical protein
MDQERARFILKCLLSEIDHPLTNRMTEWEETFVTDIGIRLEANHDLQLTPKQMNKLSEIFKTRNT